MSAFAPPPPCRPRASERGAAIFVVVMTITMLAAIGVFSIRAASLASAASGFDRQNTQNHYVSEYGLLGAATELSSSRLTRYYTDMYKGAEPCAANQGVPPPALPHHTACRRLFAAEVQKQVDANFSGRLLFDPATSGSTVTPGSLGPSPLDGDFLVEMTDPGVVGMVAGMAADGPWHYEQVTLTVTGQVRPSGTNTCQDVGGTVDVKGQIAGNEMGRGLVVIGPIQGKAPQ